MPLAKVAAWALMTLLVCLWALYNRRIALERRRLMTQDRPTPPQDQRAPL
jgi:hypothetical protein